MSNHLSEQRKRTGNYLALMEEIKIRLNIINDAHKNQANYPVPMVREICYLQFRLICEIIALACLVAHGDIKEADAIKQTYEPGKIMAKLERLNPHFYPQPIVVTFGLRGRILTAAPEMTHLSKKDLRMLWGRSGDFLHRSPMVKMFKQMEYPHSDFSDVFEWGAKITGLLNSHWISLVDSKKGMHVSMSVAPHGKSEASVLDFSTDPKSVSVDTLTVE